SSGGPRRAGIPCRTSSCWLRAPSPVLPTTYLSVGYCSVIIPHVARTQPAARTGRRRMRAPERRAQLLDVARRVFGASGFHAVSMETVAKEAGVTKPKIGRASCRERVWGEGEDGSRKT